MNKDIPNLGTKSFSLLLVGILSAFVCIYICSPEAMCALTHDNILARLNRCNPNITLVIGKEDSYFSLNVLIDCGFS